MLVKKTKDIGVILESIYLELYIANQEKEDNSK